VFDGSVGVVVLDARAGPNRSQEEIAVGIPVHGEIDVRRRSVAHETELGTLDLAIAVEVVPEPEATLSRLRLAGKDHDVPGIGAWRITAERGTVALESIHADCGDRKAAWDPIREGADDKLWRHRRSLEREGGTAGRWICIDVVAGTEHAVVLKIARVGK